MFPHVPKHSAKERLKGFWISACRRIEDTHFLGRFDVAGQCSGNAGDSLAKFAFSIPSEEFSSYANRAVAEGADPCVYGLFSVQFCASSLGSPYSSRLAALPIAPWTISAPDTRQYIQAVNAGKLMSSPLQGWLHHHDRSFSAVAYIPLAQNQVILAQTQNIVYLPRREKSTAGAELWSFPGFRGSHPAIHPENFMAIRAPLV